MTIESTRPRADRETVEHDATTKPTTDHAEGARTSRRAFLGGTTAAVAAGGVLAALPLISSSDPALRAKLARTPGLQHVSLDDPLIVHVSDLESGEISLYAGERHIVVHDKDLANRLAEAVINDTDG